jgi:hypothetical protein
MTVPLNKEIQYRDERIQVLQAEIEQLRKTQEELTKQVEIFVFKLFLFLFYANKLCFFLRHRIDARVFLHLWEKMN